jgi:hypothetical protein
MRSKIKVSKISGVIFLTVLIWVWADLALERPLLLTSRSLRLTTSPDPALAFAFEKEGEYPISVLLNQVVLKGPEATIRNVDRMLREKLEFVLNPEMLGVSEPGLQTFPLLDLLRRIIVSDKRLAGLTVESCEPKNVTVRVERLTKAVIPVECVDQQGIPLEGASMEPAEVEMLVPQAWVQERRAARVSLTEAEIERARLKPSQVLKKPFVMILGLRREADVSVRISTPDIEAKLETGVIGRPNLGFVLSQTLQNRYLVVLDEANLNKALNPIQFRATVPARLTYEKMPYHVLLEVKDEDTEVEQIAPRRLNYNFPPDYAGTGQIRLDQEKVSVTFKLVPRSAGGTEPGAPN